jgi:hypothetical protein
MMKILGENLFQKLHRFFPTLKKHPKFSPLIKSQFFQQKTPIFSHFQISSIGPFIFMLLERCFKLPFRHGRIIQISLFVCACTYIPLFLAWDKTASIFGTQHSITLILCIFVLGMICISSDIIWVPYTANFGNQYLPAYFVGAGWCALFPSILSLIQGEF